MLDWVTLLIAAPLFYLLLGLWASTAAHLRATVSGGRRPPFLTVLRAFSVGVLVLPCVLWLAAMQGIAAEYEYTGDPHRQQEK